MHPPPKRSRSILEWRQPQQFAYDFVAHHREQLEKSTPESGRDLEGNGPRSEEHRSLKGHDGVNVSAAEANPPSRARSMIG